MKTVRRILLVIFGLITVAGVTIVALYPGLIQMMAGNLRKAYALEFAYSYLAADLSMPELCEKISGNAILTAAFSPRGHQISYAKSECYQNVAIVMQDKALCEKVRSISTGILDGSETNTAECMTEVEKSRGWLGSHGGDADLAARFMGFTDSDYQKLMQEKYGDVPLRERIFDGSRLMASIEGTPEAVQRAKRLPDFSSSPVGFDPLLLNEMGCVGDNAPQWFCLYGRCLQNHDPKFRDACIAIAAGIQFQSRGYDGKKRTAEKLAKEYVKEKEIFEQYPQLVKAFNEGVEAMWSGEYSPIRIEIELEELAKKTRAERQSK